MKGGASLSRIPGSRNLSLTTAKVNTIFGPEEVKIETFSGSHAQHVNNGTVTPVPFAGIKHTVERSKSPQIGRKVTLGGKRRRSARRKTRKTLRHSHRRK